MLNAKQTASLVILVMDLRLVCENEIHLVKIK